MSDFQKWKKQQGFKSDTPAGSVVSKASQSTKHSNPVNSHIEAGQSAALPTLTKATIEKLNSSYAAQVAYKRSGISNPPSEIGSIRSNMSSVSMIDRLAQIEALLAKTVETMGAMNTQRERDRAIIEKQDKLLTMLAAKVIGETIGPDDSASQTTT